MPKNITCAHQGGNVAKYQHVIGREKDMVALLILLALVVVVLFYGARIYNQLVALKNRYKNAFAQIDVQLQRRYDLIPNLVATAKKYLQHEEETLTQVIQARRQAVAATQQARSDAGGDEAMALLGQAEGALAGALMNFNAVAENYPDLKANDTMRQLMEELTSTENRIGFARQAYNDGVMHYNTYREQFPHNMVAGFASFQAAHTLELVDPVARENVKVNF